ncbi:MAG TPA: phosphate ABC transporter substrate-binding protein PstS family protein [Candidatus Limnocylindria bacterium]|nr:phosphate ABC transporter substrate-binding protein PstS family protein [Candidatus Limnocylindria bacterium]
MTHFARVRPALAGILAGAALLAACSNTGSPAGSAVTGTLTISGSSTVEPITSLVAEDFQALNPDVEYTVDGPGTGDGFALFCNGETDISDASRAIKDEEAAACADKGIHYVELKVAIDGLSVITSPANDAVSCLSFLDLYALLGPESQGFDRWSDANGLAGELASLEGFGDSHAPYPDAALEVTAPGEESGTYDSFVEFAIAKIAGEREQDAVTNPDYVASGDDNVIIEGISDSDGSLGWVGFAFADESSDSVKSLEVDGGDGCVAPTPETIASGEYPMARPLFIYVNTDKEATNPAITAFVDYYLSDAGMAVVTEVDYVALDADELAATRSTWDSR